MQEISKLLPAIRHRIDSVVRGETGENVKIVGRHWNSVRTFGWTLLLVLASVPLASIAQLPPHIQADLYVQRAQSAIESQDYAEARLELEKILELQPQHDSTVPAEFSFPYVEPLRVQGASEDALRNALLHLVGTGQDRDSYMAALKLVDRLAGGIAEAEEQGIPKELPSEVRAMEFVRIPAGTFQMGSESGSSDELPLRQVRISRAFEIGKHEVTQSEWSAVMGQNPSEHRCDRCPVTNISWNAVQEFIGILNQAQEQGSPYRLPTEAEWEYASRAGTTEDRYASEVDAIAWHLENGDFRTHPVGEKMPNAFGVYDMLGNVSEWVQDRYGPYSSSSVTDPVGPTDGPYRVHRGGSLSNFASDCRAASRRFSSPGYRPYYLGFRLARTL